ncbi:MAG: YlxR family protein [Bifidobacteriaceae bacterium]|nr:YlxR family protein [Bifidobacteriaceae bacterium]
MASTPTRTCVGCREREPCSNLIRLVLDTSVTPALVAVDRRDGLPGRGAWLHSRRQCVDRAISRKVWARAFRHQGGVDVSALQGLVRPDQTKPAGETDGHTMSALR